MTVGEFCELFIEPELIEVSLWDINTDKCVFEGFFGDMPDNLYDTEINCIDNPLYSVNKKICINIIQ